MGFLWNRNKKNHPYTALVLAAGGSSRRMAGENKLLIELNGIPVIAHTLLAFENCGEIDEIVIASREEDLVIFSQVCKEFEISKAKKVVCGGDTRLKSVYAGIFQVSKETKFIAVHDAARPLITTRLIEEVVKDAYRFGCAIPAVEIKDTIKEVDPNQQLVVRTLERSALRAIQTPQVFDADLIKGALSRALELGIEATDDSALVEQIGMKVHISQGSFNNIKITTPEDIKIAETILSERYDS